MATKEALGIAREEGLDLIEVAPSASPPVCKVMDYGRYRYEQRRKDKDASRRQRIISDLKTIVIKRVAIGEHDLQTKAKRARKFLGESRKVRFNLWFRGRERAHMDRGRALLERIAEECEAVATVESSPSMDGRNMTMTLAPKAETGPPKEE